MEGHDFVPALASAKVDSPYGDKTMPISQIIYTIKAVKDKKCLRRQNDCQRRGCCCCRSLKSLAVKVSTLHTSRRLWLKVPFDFDEEENSHVIKDWFVLKSTMLSASVQEFKWQQKV